MLCYGPFERDYCVRCCNIVAYCAGLRLNLFVSRLVIRLMLLRELGLPLGVCKVQYELLICFGSHVFPHLHIKQAVISGMTDPTYSITGLIATIDHVNGNIADWNAGVTEPDGEKAQPVEYNKQSLATISN